MVFWSIYSCKPVCWLTLFIRISGIYQLVSVHSLKDFTTSGILLQRLEFGAENLQNNAEYRIEQVLLLHIYYT